MPPLSGQSAIVTGGGRGIGAATAQALTQLGARVTVFARSAPELERLVAAGHAHLAVAGDVSLEADVARLFSLHRQAHGPCTVLVNNAGVVDRDPVEALSAERFRRQLEVNLTGAFLCVRAAVPEMKEQGRGRIVNVASISGTLGTARQSAYNASKWGLIGLTKSIAEELREFGVLCMAVSPGSTDTRMLDKSPFTPRMKAEDIARIIAWCASEAPAAMTGANIESFG